MDTKNPRAGGARASKSTAADTEAFSAISPEKQTRRPFAVVITRGLWRGCIVAIEPPTITRQPRSFPSHDAAMAYAVQLADVEQWPIFDRAGGAE